MSKARKKLPLIFLPTIFAVAIAIVVFWIKFTPHVLNPMNYDWLMSFADCPTEYVSWQFFRNTNWHFPVIGTLEGYDYPTVTGIGLTGAIPLLAIPFKILSPYLPTDFQYFGLWFLACYVLQAVFAVRLLRGLFLKYHLHLSTLALTFGSVFFILSPALLTRTGHINLCGQWLILWSLCVYFEPRTTREKFISFLKIIATTALIHQYLLLMVFGLAFATYWKSEKTGRFSWLIKGLMSLAGFVLAMTIWFFVGNFNTAATQMTQIGFGKYSANLNTFFNGQGEQALLPTLAFTEGQYEGQGYLGAGILLMALLAVLAYLFRFRRPDSPEQSFSPLALIASGFTLFALSYIITLGNKTVIGMPFLIKNHLFHFISQAFRSSGRFIWVMHYWLMAICIVGFMRIRSHRILRISGLFILLLIQVTDVKPMLTREHKYLDFDGYTPSVMTFKTWLQITSEGSRLVMLPPYTWHYKEQNDYINFARIAAFNHQDITTGYLARPDWEAHAQYEKKTFAALEKGELGDEQNSIFIATKHSVRKLKKAVESGQIKIFMYEDYIVGVPIHFTKTVNFLSNLSQTTVPDLNTEGLAEFLEKNKKETILAVVKDDGASKLCDEVKNQFQKMGADMPKFILRSGMAIIIKNGKFVFQKITSDSEGIVQKFKKGETISDFTFKTNLELHSAGATSGNFGKIIINDKDFSMNQRGFNLVVIDKDFKVLKTAYFDTFDDCYSGEIKTKF